MSVSTTPTSDPSPVQAILSEAETGGFSGSGRVERHAIARGDGGRVRAAQLVIEDAAIGEDDIGHRSPVAVYVPRHDLHDLTEDELRGERFGPAPEVLADLGADNAVQANLDGGPVLKDRDGIAVRNTDNLPRELFGRGERDPRDD